MLVWDLRQDCDKYDNFVFVNKEDWSIIDSFDGRSLKYIWVSLIVKVDKKRKKCDCPSLNPAVPVFSEKAVEALRDLLEGSTEVLPIEYDMGIFKAINVTNIVNALDHENSEFRRFSTGETMYCTKFAFKPELIKEQHIFKIPEFPRGHVFVSDEFRNRVIQKKLKGFRFIEAWNSEEL